MKTIQQKEQELLADFEIFADWNDKYNYIMDMAIELPLLDENDKITKNIVKGCQSASWLTLSMQGDKVYFKGDSEAILGRGVISLLLNLLNGHTKNEVVQYDFAIIYQIDLPNHLSPTRKMGLEAIMKRIKELVE